MGLAVQRAVRTVLVLCTGRLAHLDALSYLACRGSVIFRPSPLLSFPHPPFPLVGPSFAHHPLARLPLHAQMRSQRVASISIQAIRRRLPRPRRSEQGSQRQPYARTTIDNGTAERGFHKALPNMFQLASITSQILSPPLLCWCSLRKSISVPLGNLARRLTTLIASSCLDIRLEANP